MNQIVKTALKYVGYPAIYYKNNSSDGVYCSSFIEQVLLELGIEIPNIPSRDEKIKYSEQLFDFFGISVQKKFIKPGDFVFFSRNGFRPTHVGIYIGDGKMVHSPGVNGRKVEIRSIKDYIKERPLEFDPEEGHEQIYEENPIGFKRPAILTGDRYQEPLI